MYGSAVVLVSIAVSSIFGTTIAATTTASLLIKSSRPAVRRTAANNTAERTITLRQNFQNNGDQCECTLFYVCDNNNVVDVSTSDVQNPCGDDHVCCRVDPSSSSASPESPNPEPTRTNPVQPSNCICVPFWQCLDYPTPTESTVSSTSSEDHIEGLINPRITPTCQDAEFCCSVERIDPNYASYYITSSPTPATTPSSTTEYYIPPSVVTTESSSKGGTNVVQQECGIKGQGPSPSVDETDSLIIERITNDNENAETVFGEYPWMVALFRNNENNELICGASLLTPSLVLTAAHCVRNISSASIKVRAGEYNIGSEINETLPHQDRFVNMIKMHPNFHNKRLYNDIALLSLNEPFNYNSHINAICLPFENSLYTTPHQYDPTKCWVTGWGKQKITDNNVQRKLKKVELPIVERDECQKSIHASKLGSKFTLDPSFICAGGQKGYDSCKGDGGGPLICVSRTNRNQYIQVGIVSWGLECGEPIPGFYASLEANNEWITSQINSINVFGTFS